MKSGILAKAAVAATIFTVAQAIPSRPSTTRQDDPTTTTTHPCGKVAELWSAQISTTATPTASASLAYECLNSIPLYKEAAIQYIDELEPYLEFQSDIAFKKNPPPDYPYEGYDMFEELRRVRSKINRGGYSNEYEWQLDLYLSVVGKGHDGHFEFFPDLLARAVEFARPLSLVSVSEDGKSLPVIKVYEDIESPSETASPVDKINGIDAAQYLENWTRQISANQDLDAAYNTMFFEKAFLAIYENKGYFESGGRGAYIYPGPTTNITFANKTTIDFTNIARLKFDWKQVSDAESFVKKIILFKHAGADARARISRTVTMLDRYEASGYFLNAPGFESVAVLALLSFNPGDSVAFQKVVQDFFAKCVEAGKTKLIVDLQSNGGGMVLQGYDTFRQMFPDIVQQGLERWRFHPEFEAFSKTISNKCAGYSPYGNSSSDMDYLCNWAFNWRFDLDATNQHFLSYEDKFAPLEFNDDEYTQLTQYDLENPQVTVHGFGNDITGYGKRKNFTRPFSNPEDIVLLYDGYCASTCTIFSQFMNRDAGVKSIALGGRPMEGAIQGVGGVKGTNNLQFASIYDLAKGVSQKMDDPGIPKQFRRFTSYVDSRCDATGLNVRDAILREHIEDGIPSQYIREESDCRLYWTESMVMDMEEVWKAAANVAFKGGECAAGGIAHNGSVH